MASAGSQGASPIRLAGPGPFQLQLTAYGQVLGFWVPTPGQILPKCWSPPRVSAILDYKDSQNSAGLCQFLTRILWETD